MTKEQKFLNALKDIFVGAKVEGESGFINLMRIKSCYFEKGVFPRLMEDINKALEPFPDFREELFDRLYTFFRRYFSETGSIYYRHTPLHERVYEQVYTDDRDVMLFWKTHMLYYVKTDRLFKSMGIEVDGFRFFFDVSSLEHKKNNEKRELVYNFKEIRSDGTIIFDVSYSERGRKTKLDDIRKEIKNALGLPRYTDQVPAEEVLKNAFRTFERQSEVDYFICKDVRKFLKEQFDLWLYRYVFEPEYREESSRGSTIWSEKRIRQLQVLKEIAYKIIDFIAQFEEELVRIWNKPKFVLDSGYVLTLDRIVKQDGGVEMLRKVLTHPGVDAQIQEWRELGLIDSEFTLEKMWATDSTSTNLDNYYQYLPLDTRYFKELEPELLALFENLDQQLDGWLIKSENYQALNTLLLKFGNRINSVYIDPPYNEKTTEIYYENNYKHSSWLTMMENRLNLSRLLLARKFVYMVAINEVERKNLDHLLSQYVFRENTVASITVVHNQRGQQGKNLSEVHEYLHLVYPDDSNKYLKDRVLDEADHRNLRDSGTESLREDAKNCFYPIIIKDGKIIGFGEVPPDDFHPKSNNEIKEDGTILVWPIDTNGEERKWRYARNTVETILNDLEVVESLHGLQIYYNKKTGTIRTVWQDDKYDASEYGTKTLQALFGKDIKEHFKYPKSVYLVQDCISIINIENPLILDFFAGSGTTAHAVINLNRDDGGQRKYILVEMADYFDIILLPRIKKVIFSDKWKDGKAQENGKGISHFVKYFRLEQYEDVLRRACYKDAEPIFIQTDPYSQYVFLRDPKMLDNAQTGEKVMTVDLEKDEIRIDFSKLSDNIDLAETLSCVTGKWIRRIRPRPDDPGQPGEVEFEDGTRVNLTNPPWELVKPLIWW